MGTFFFVAEWKPASFSAFLTVWGWTGLERVELIKFVAWTALSSLPEVSWQRMDCLLQVESLVGQPPGLFSLLEFTSLPILLIVPNPRPVCWCIWWWEYPCSRRESTEEHLAAEVGLMVVVKGQEIKNQVQHVKLTQIESHDLVYCSHSLFVSCIGTKSWNLQRLKKLFKCLHVLKRLNWYGMLT